MQGPTATGTPSDRKRSRAMSGVNKVILSASRRDMPEAALHPGAAEAVANLRDRTTRGDGPDKEWPEARKHASGTRVVWANRRKSSASTSRRAGRSTSRSHPTRQWQDSRDRSVTRRDRGAERPDCWGAGASGRPRTRTRDRAARRHDSRGVRGRDRSTTRVLSLPNGGWRGRNFRAGASVSCGFRSGVRPRRRGTQRFTPC